MIAWLALLLLAATSRLYTVKRLLVVGLPYLALLVAYLLAPARWWVIALLLGLELAATLVVVTRHRPEPWRQVITAVAQAQPGAVATVWVDDLAAPAMDYYARRLAIPPDSVRWTPLVATALPRLPETAPAPGEMLWLLTPETEYRRLAALLPPAFFAEYQPLSSDRQDGIGVYRFQRRLAPLTSPPPRPQPSRQDLWGLLFPSPLATCQ